MITPESISLMLMALGLSGEREVQRSIIIIGLVDGLFGHLVTDVIELSVAIYLLKGHVAVVLFDGP